MRIKYYFSTGLFCHSLNTGWAEDNQRPQGRNHYDEQVCDRKMGEKERQNASCAVGRDGTGDVILVRNRLMLDPGMPPETMWCAVCATTKGHVDIQGPWWCEWPVLPSGALVMSGLCYIQGVWVHGHTTTGAMLMSMTCASTKRHVGVCGLARNRAAVSALTALYLWWYCVHQRESRTIARISMTEATEGNPREVSVKIWYWWCSRSHRP